MVSAGHVGGTLGSGIVSSAADVLWMSVELVEYVRCVCVWLGAALVERGVGGLGLGFTNPVETGGVLDVCLCFACGGVAWTRVWRGGVVLWLCAL